MYASDYGFAAEPSAWYKKLSYDYNDKFIKNFNWMYMGLYEWTISRNAGNAYYVFTVRDEGDMSDGRADYPLGVRPVFNLISSITYVSGDGSQSSPIRVN